jgi:hypothetical protein
MITEQMRVGLFDTLPGKTDGRDTKELPDLFNLL